ncbi:MAG: DUF6153 family protein [Nocardioidaceae bacterium]
MRPSVAAKPGGTPLRLAGLLMVLAGLFGMHGLVGHGDGGMQTSSRTAMSGMSMSPIAAGFHASVIDEGDLANPLAGQARRPVQFASAPGHVGMDMSMAMCMAILAVGLIALLRLLLGRGVSSVWWSLPRQVRARVYPGRAADPPSLTALSIRRC